MIKTLQNYRILSQIGEGGMGIVYLGEHISLKRKVAIKALHPNFSGNNTIRQRFINEGITLSNLNHPNIVILYDFIEQSDGLYLVMEYVEGNTLDNLLETRKEPVKEEEFIPIFKKILNAFQYAHSRGIIHRDIKPSNILLNQYLEPKILDFGIAKIVESNVKITSTGMRLGSILYMSPEQVLGKEIDIRTDIYSLGITLFEVLTGRTPYDVTTNSEYEIQTKIVMEDLKPAKLFNPLLSERINLIIHKATAKEPTARFQNCEEFMRALDGEEITLQRGDIQKTQIQGVPVGISRPGVPPVGIPVKKGINPAIIIISVVSFMVIVTLAVLIFLKAKDKKESSSENFYLKDYTPIETPKDPPTTPKVDKDSPEGRIRTWIEALGSQDFYTAWEITGGSRWGPYSKFSSTRAYGGINYTKIYDVYTISNNGYEATVYADYDSYDPVNKDGRYKQYFYMVKRNGQWEIKKISNSEIIYYRR